VRATDAAGNKGSDSRSFTVDTVPPTVAIDTHPDNPTKSTSAAFTFHSPSDAAATYACAIVTTGTPTFSPCTSAQSYAGLSGAGQSGTSHTFEVEATDAAGNTGSPATFTWVVDTTAPTTTITAKPPNPSAALTASFTFGANETSTFTCKLDSGSTASCNNGTVANGTHTFSVFATDTAGNAGTAATYTWVANNSAPTITQAPPAGWTVDYF